MQSSIYAVNKNVTSIKISLRMFNLFHWEYESLKSEWILILVHYVLLRFPICSRPKDRFTVFNFYEKE